MDYSKNAPPRLAACIGPAGQSKKMEIGKMWHRPEKRRGSLIYYQEMQALLEEAELKKSGVAAAVRLP